MASIVNPKVELFITKLEKGLRGRERQPYRHSTFQDSISNVHSCTFNDVILVLSSMTMMHFQKYKLLRIFSFILFNNLRNPLALFAFKFFSSVNPWTTFRRRLVKEASCSIHCLHLDVWIFLCIKNNFEIP